LAESYFVALAKKRCAELQALNRVDNFYDYGKEFESLWRHVGREVLEANISTLPADRRKKTLTKFGKVSLNKTHAFSEGANGI
jgi:hypothetical protein